MTKMDKKKDSFLSCRGLWRFVYGICVFLGAADLLLSAGIRIAAYFINQNDFTLSETVSIGIIGGADGPTSILVSLQPLTSYVFPVLLIAVGLIGCYRLSKKTEA